MLEVAAASCAIDQEAVKLPLLATIVNPECKEPQSDRGKQSQTCRVMMTMTRERLNASGTQAVKPQDRFGTFAHSRSILFYSHSVLAIFAVHCRH